MFNSGVKELAAQNGLLPHPHEPARPRLDSKSLTALTQWPSLHTNRRRANTTPEPFPHGTR